MTVLWFKRTVGGLMSQRGKKESFMILERHKNKQNKWSLTLECWLEKGLAGLCLVLTGLDTCEIFFSLISYNLH
jgi:hypothetical protein